MKKIFIILGLIVSILIGFAHAELDCNDSGSYLCTTFEKLAEGLIRNTLELDFNGGQNRMGGLMLIYTRQNLPNAEEIKLYEKKKFCSKQLYGYYYNRARGNVVWPLDNKSKNDAAWGDTYNNLVISGGLYTACYDLDTKTKDPDSVYGDIAYYGTGNNKLMFHLISGVGLDYKNNSLSGTSTTFKKSLQFINGIRPIGLLRDSDWGIAFVGGDLGTNEEVADERMEKIIAATNDGSTIKQLVSFKPGDTNIYFNSSVGGGFATMLEGTDISIDSVVSVIGNFGISKANTQNASDFDSSIKAIAKSKGDTDTRKGSLIGGEILNLGSILNSVKQNQTRICRDKWVNSIEDVTISSDGIYCYKFTIQGKSLIINADLTTSGKKSIISVEDGNVVIKTSQAGPGYLNLFVNKGYLAIENNSNNNDTLKYIDGEGKIVSAPGTGLTAGFALKGNYYVNGLLVGANNSAAPIGLNHKLYIYGSLASFNTISNPADARIKVVKGILSDNKSENFIQLDKAITWECRGDGIASDGVKCGSDIDNYAKNLMIVQKTDTENDFAISM